VANRRKPGRLRIVGSNFHLMVVDQLSKM